MQSYINKELRLYNSRIVKMYIDYLKKYYPHIDIDSIFKYSGLSSHEVNDQGQWFTQQQINRFHTIMDEKTGNHEISRDVGRYFASTKGMNPVRQYALGLISLSYGYELMGRIHNALSRASSITINKLEPNKIELCAIPKPGVKEELFQCKNRLGGIESLAMFFTKKYANVDHPTCIHKGDSSCKYIITWEKTLSIIWKRIRNYSIIIIFFVLLTLYFLLSISAWYHILLAAIVTVLSLTCFAEVYEKKELLNILENQGDAASDLIDQINIRYDNALLVQEIGQAISSIMDIDKLLITITKTMREYLDFDRGLIMLANKERTRLIYATGYGHTKEQEKILQTTQFHLDKPTSKGVFVQTFKRKEPFLEDNAEKIQKGLSRKSIEFAQKLKVHSVICVPIVYENQSLGIIAVDNIKTKRELTKSDINLLMGIAAQTATSINNAISYRKLHESEERFRAIFESTTDSIFVWDRNYTYLYANKAALKQLKKSHHEVIGKNLIDVLGDMPDSMSMWKSKIDSVFITKKPLRISDVRSYEGKVIHSESDISPLMDAEGNVFAVGFIYRDITEREQAREETARLQSQLRQAQKMEAIGTLAGGIAHDFNNILFPIIGYSEMIMDDLPENDKRRDDLEEVLNAAIRAKDLVQQILTFSHKHEQKQMLMIVQPVVKEALKLLRSVIPANIEFQTNIDPNCGPILADPMQIHQIIMNLCTNAYHAMRDNGGTLEVNIDMVKTEDSSELQHSGIKLEDAYVRLMVKDTGIGMPPEIIERIFEPYFTTKDLGEGTGMGLSIVHGIIKSHNGHCIVNSKPGEGTTFEIYFPHVEAAYEEKSLTKEPVPAGNNEKILVVDDDMLVLSMVEKMLNRLGYDVTARTSSMEALRQFRNQPDNFDLVITDMMMPMLTGNKLVEKILEIRPDTPIILCSGGNDIINEEKARQIGAKEYIVKPISINIIARKIRNVLDAANIKTHSVA